MAEGFQWVVAPSEELMPSIEAYGERALAAVQAAATYWGQSIQDEARKNAPWQDRSGNARSGLFFAVDGFGQGTVTGTVTVEPELIGDEEIIEGDENTLVVVLAHTMYYGRYLELDHGGRYAIIMSTIEGNLSNLERLVKDIFR